MTIFFWFAIFLLSFQQQRALCDDTCIVVDYLQKEIGPNKACSTSNFCDKDFNILYINTPPYTYTTMNELKLKEIEYLLHICCGNCSSISEHTQTELKNITELTLPLIRQADFIYPIFGRASTDKLYDMYYLPYYDIAKVLYITKRKNEVKLIEKIFALYPLIVISILFALVAGFIAWLIETWSNKEEFPRPFLIGWFDGFWWSFVSMTTVGYGDKSPRTVIARLFSIVWILIGLIVCGILTGELTGQIVKANSPPTPDMKGAKVGVLNYREYDAYVVAQHGGVIYRNEDADDFMSDFQGLADDLKQDYIDGMTLDYETYSYLYDKLREFNNSLSSVEKKFDGEQFTYGILVRDKKDYEYLKEYVADYRYRIQAYSKRDWNTETENNKLFFVGNSILFSPSSKYFVNTITAVAIMLSLIVMFGILFELQRKKFICKHCVQVNVLQGQDS